MQPPEFRFRLNGEIMPELVCQRALVDGEPVGQWEIVVDVEWHRAVHHRRQLQFVGPRPAAVRAGVPGRDFVGHAARAAAAGFRGQGLAAHDPERIGGDSGVGGRNQDRIRMDEFFTETNEDIDSGSR
jgi:hypothetical protein